MIQTKSIVKEIDKVEDAAAENITHKERYLKAMNHNSDDLDEEQLGVRLGFSKEYTHKIIEELTVEGNITRQITSKGHDKLKEEK